MPLVSQTFDQLLDFTRTSAATFVGSNGLIQTTPASVNLFVQTQQFDAASWTKEATTATANVTTAPDGTFTADKIAATATTVFHNVRQAVTQTVATYTYSVYAKASEYSKLILANATSGTWSATFDLATGATISTGGAAVLSSAIQSAGNGWYRCSVTFTGAAVLTSHVAVGYPDTGATLNNFGASYTGDGTSGLFLWGAQLQTGSTATTYTRNNGGVFPPRFDYDPVTLAPKGLLIEEQRVNLVTGSADFTATYWPVATNAVVTADNTTSPDGTTNADRLADNTTAGVQHRIYRDYTFTATSHTLSVFAKRNDHRWLRLFFFDGTTSFFGNFDLLNGVVGSKQASATTTITAFGNGWYRCTMTATTAAAAGNIQLVMLPADDAAVPVLYTGTGTSLWLFGAQLEAGAFATSYIPTVASQVTRTADQCSIVAPNFAPWYNQSEGTFVFEGSSVGPSTLAQTLNALVASDGTNNNVHRVGRFLNFWFSETRNGNVQQANPSAAGSYTENATAKVAYAYKTNDFALSANGATAVTDTSGTVPTVITRLNIGNPTIELNGHIRSIRYFPVRLSNAQLQALTA